MKQSDDTFESELARQYQSAKSQVKVPPGIKQNLMHKAARIDKEKHANWSKYWFAQLAVATSILVLGFITLFPQSHNTSQNPSDHIIAHHIIEFHTFENSPLTSESTSLAYANLEQEFARKALLIAAVQKQAKLNIKNDGTWELNTCEQQNILISSELVAMLDKYDVLPELPQSGMVVNIGFDKRGHIIQIESSQSSMLC